jgi:hypothetical protein
LLIANSPHRRVFESFKPFQTSALPETDCQETSYMQRVNPGMLLAKNWAALNEKHSNLAG